MSLNLKVCFFTGHRVINKKKCNAVISWTREEILNKINSGVTVFITGGALGFDTLAAEQVIDMREDYDFIRLCLYLPCTDQHADWSDADRDRFEKIKAAADDIFYVTNSGYKRGCMRKRNLAMVEASNCGIAYLTNHISGSAQTVKMAQEKGIPVINIAKLIENE